MLEIMYLSLLLANLCADVDSGLRVALPAPGCKEQFAIDEEFIVVVPYAISTATMTRAFGQDMIAVSDMATIKALFHTSQVMIALLQRSVMSFADRWARVSSSLTDVQPRALSLGTDVSRPLGSFCFALLSSSHIAE
ncbi:hypothetical protein LTR95_003016 [Oleoguttula sp. CCFEE 5521]